MSMFKDTVTLYNKYVEDGTERWKRTVLPNVYWNDIRGTILRKTGVESACSVVIIIPRRTGYQKPKVWLKDRFGWTLQPGDTVVRGGVQVEIQRSISKELDLDDVLTITSVDHKDFGGSMAHWEVLGK